MPWIVLIYLSIAASWAENNAMVQILSPEAVRGQLSVIQVIDARPTEKFQEAHIPGSLSMPWDDWSQEKPGFWNSLFGHREKWGKVLDDPTPLQRRLRAMGLSHRVPILVVGEPHQWGEEGRIAWNFLFWGATQVALLDGGFPAWQTKFPSLVEKGAPQTRLPGDFEVRLIVDRRATMSELKSKLGAGTLLLDARTEEEFRGKTMFAQKRGGRIPGAHLVPVASLYHADGTYLSARELKALVPVPTTKPTAYCTGGVRSALLVLLIEARLGVRGANYDGSMWEWSMNSELPLEQGSVSP